MKLTILDSLRAGSSEAVPAPNHVDACVTALGFPDSLNCLIEMADRQSEWTGHWMTNLESLFTDDDQGNWTGARWMTEGDILFFYQSGNRPKRFVRRLLRESRTLAIETTTDLVELLERNLELIDRYGDTIFGCAEVTGPSEYIPRDGGEEDALHFRNRTFVPYHKFHAFEVPLGGEPLKQQVMISRRGAITPLAGKDFDGVKRVLAENNVLPDYLLRSKPGRSFQGISKATWREISCAPDQGFTAEFQIRAYLLDYLLDEMKDQDTPLLEECGCFRDGQRTGRADYFIQVGKQWIAVEAKVNILSERDILDQVSRYTNIKFLEPEKGPNRGDRFESDSSGLCLVADRAGLYLIDHGKFVYGEPSSPAWLRKDLTSSVVMQIRETIISRLMSRDN
jgi:hypothetical protein